MTQAVGVAERRVPAEVEVQVVDVDVHPDPRSPDELRQYIPEPWRSRPWSDRLFTSLVTVSPLYVAPGNARRLDAFPPGGGPPCSDPAFAEQQLFQGAGVDYAMLIPIGGRPLTNPEHEAAYLATMNTWLAETWLSKYNRHGRYRGTLRVCAGSPTLAAREIERWAGHPYFKQVMLDPYVPAPYGQEQYAPIFDAAVRHSFVMAMHVAVRRPGMGLLTPVGFVSYFFEYHALYPLLFGAHLISLLCEGVFDRYPSLKFVFVEGGFGWVLPLLWRLDNHWQELRTEVPGLKRRPLAYLRDHIRLTTQPIEEPSSDEHLAKLLEWMDAEHLLMFATDYPHWDGDYYPQRVFPRLPAHVRRRILRDNALELYDLPPTRMAAGAGI